MKKIQLIIKILAVVLVVAIAFVGIYVQKQNRMENIVKDYSLGMDLEGSRVIELKVSDEKKEITKDKDGNVVKEEDKKEDGKYTTEEQPVNSDEVKTLENYKKSKSIIEKRLKELGVGSFITKLDEENGTIILEIPENTETDHTVSNISQTGEFKIVDSEDEEKVLMDNNDIKKASVLYNTGTTGTVVYLNIEFNKEGKEKIKNISTEYATNEDSDDSSSDEESSDDSAEDSSDSTSEESSDKEEQKKITMKIDDTDMISTSFDDVIENGSIQLSMGQASAERSKVNDNIKSASTIATVLDVGKLPVVYETESNQYIATDITTDLLLKIAIVAGAVLLVAILVLVFKYKGLGILAGIELIGFTAIYTLLIRYTNVVITLEGLSAFAVIIVLNYVFNYKLLGRIKELKGEERIKAITDEFLSFCIKVIPICILSIVFCFINWTPISSFGMVMFWGLIMVALYNITVAKSFLK